MLIRTELFSLPPLAMMIVATADNRRVLTAIAAVLTVMAPLHIVTHYGNELYDYVSPGELAGFRYIADHLTPAKIYGGFPGGGFLKSATLRWRNSTVPNANSVPAPIDYLEPNAHGWGSAPETSTWLSVTATSPQRRCFTTSLTSWRNAAPHGAQPPFPSRVRTPDFSIYSGFPGTQAAAGQRQRLWGAPRSQAGACRGLLDRVYRGPGHQSRGAQAEDAHPDQVPTAAAPPRRRGGKLPRRLPGAAAADNALDAAL